MTPKHSQSYWQTEDGLKLYHQSWEPETKTKAVICLVHGIGEHSGRYQQVASFFVENGYALLTFDLRGHGKSAGQRGHAPSFEHLMSDIDLLLTEAGQRFPGIPLFLYGHSLGGMLVLNYVLRRTPVIMGTVSTSPALRTSVDEQTAKIFLAKILGKILPGLSLPTDLDVNMLSRDPAVVQAYQTDPLVHNQGTLALANGVFEAVPWAFAHADQFPVPLLLVHGTADQITYARGSQEFASQAKGDVTLKLWEGLYHETHNEPEKEQVLAYTLDWLNTKLENGQKL